ncbi:MAG: hypothetical protein UH239_07205 [Acutalibacteraceae bacterium]|nr:hypothetical protein [Acutalibacteraceae bacterium]
MDNVMTKGFAELSVNEMIEIDGGSKDGVLGFLGDIYDGWCSMWKDFGKNIYRMTH